MNNSVSQQDKLAYAQQLLLKMLEAGYDGEGDLVNLAATAAKMVNRMIETVGADSE